MFIPNSIYYEKDALNYPLGKELFNKYNEKKVEFIGIENHNNIEELGRKEVISVTTYFHMYRTPKRWFNEH